MVLVSCSNYVRITHHAGTTVGQLFVEWPPLYWNQFCQAIPLLKKKTIRIERGSLYHGCQTSLVFHDRQQGN